MGIGISIANTFIEYWYLIYSNINSQYFSIAQERNLYWELVTVDVTSLSSNALDLFLKRAVKGLDFMMSLKFILRTALIEKLMRLN